MNLRAINLNLLKTLQVLLQTRNVTVASRALFISQPAVSASLKQLRALFDDELLIKGENNFFDLTHKAQLIKPLLEQWLKQGENLIGADAETIVAEKVEHTFNIALHSHVSQFIFPKLYCYLKKYAPNVKVKEITVTDLSQISYKELHQFDFIIGIFKNIPKGYCRDYCYSDRMICLSGNKLLNKKNKITIKDLNQYEHVIGSYMHDYTQSISEPFLVSHGVHRQYQMIVSDVVLAGRLARKESLLLILTKKQGEFLKTLYPLKIFELPFESPKMTTEILFKEVDQANVLIQWFKSVILSCVPGDEK